MEWVGSAATRNCLARTADGLGMGCNTPTRRLRLEQCDVALGDDALERAITHVWDAPGESPVVYLRGAWPEPTGIAVVGTRSASPEALAFTATLVGDLAAAGFSIWSGGALGIDEAAHSAALAAGATTVLVAPTGLDHPYPVEHIDLYDRVVRRGGALLSLWPDHVRAQRPRFLKRNRLLAALTAATVVVQAPVRSGARSTARSARKLGRPVCVVPHCPWCGRGAGCNHEVRAGAVPIRGAQDVIAALQLGLELGAPSVASAPLASRSPTPRPLLSPSGASSGASAGTQAHGPGAPPAAPSPQVSEQSFFNQPLSDNERAVLEALNGQPQHADAICAATSLPASAVSGALLTLTLRSEVVEKPAGHYRRGGA